MYCQKTMLKKVHMKFISYSYIFIFFGIHIGAIAQELPEVPLEN